MTNITAPVPHPLAAASRIFCADAFDMAANAGQSSKVLLRRLKKRHGQALVNALTRTGLINLPDLEHVLQYAGRIEEKHIEPILAYLDTLRPDKPKPDETMAAADDPFQLLEQADYEAFYADEHFFTSPEATQKREDIKRLFQPDELICTLNKDPDRYKSAHVVFAIRKDARTLKRCDFDGRELRDDAYGTSVISIQISKQTGFLIITNRYNHTVDACDNTHDNNPDRIIDGLSRALQAHYNISFTNHKIIEGYRFVGNQLFKENFEDNGYVYGEQAYIHQGVIHRIARENGDALFDQFRFCAKTRRLTLIDQIRHKHEHFEDSFNEAYGGRNDLRVDTNGNLCSGDTILIEAEGSRIVGLNLPDVQILQDSSLKNPRFLRTCRMPNLISMGDDCFYSVPQLKELTDMDKLETMGVRCFATSAIETLRLKSLQFMGYHCFSRSRKIKSIEMDELTEMGIQCFPQADNVANLSLKKLKEMGTHCFLNANRIKHLTLDALEFMGAECFRHVRSLEDVSFKSLEIVGSACFENADNLKVINLDSVKKIDRWSFTHVNSLTHLRLDNLEITEEGSFQFARSLRTIIMDKAEEIGRVCFMSAPSILYVGMKSLERLGYGCFESSNYIRRFDAPEAKGIPPHIKRALPPGIKPLP